MSLVYFNGLQKTCMESDNCYILGLENDSCYILGFLDTHIKEMVVLLLILACFHLFGFLKYVFHATFIVLATQVATFRHINCQNFGALTSLFSFLKL